MTKLCIFDLDGTLINSLYDLADAMNYALKKNGFPVHEREKYRFMVGCGLSVLADKAMVLPQGTNSGIKEKIIADFNSYYGEHYCDFTVPYDGITELLCRLDEKNVGYCVLSNKPDEFTVQIVKALFPKNKFMAVMGKRDEYPRKPDPASVNAIMKASGVSNGDCLYIGDSNVDMQTARNAGIRSVGVSWGFRPVEELVSSGAAHIADSPDDILRFL